MRFLILKIWVVILLIGFVNVQAQDEFEKVQVLESPRFSLLNRFAFDANLTFLPLDAYFKPIILEGAVTYQPSDLLSWEIARFGYAIHNFDTGLETSVNAQLAPVSKSVDPNDLSFSKMRYRASSTLFLNMLYSKSNFFNRSITYHQWEVGAGPAYYDMDGKDQFGIDLVLKVRFFLDNSWSVNIRGGQTIGFKSKVPKNITFLSLGVGFAL